MKCKILNPQNWSEYMKVSEYPHPSNPVEQSLKSNQAIIM